MTLLVRSWSKTLDNHLTKEVVMGMSAVRGLLVWTMVIAFTCSGVTTAFAGSRIMPSGKVKVFEGPSVVQVLEKESVFPNGTLLTTEGKCAARFDNLYLVAEDGSTFGVVENLNRKDLRVDNGMIYFAIKQNIGELNFLTPAGVISAMQVRFNAAADGGLLKGYLDVSGPGVKLGVLEGGSMVVSTAQGNQDVRAGEQILLAQADPINENEAGNAGQPGSTTPPEVVSTSAITGTQVAVGASILAGITGGVLIYNNNNDDDSNPQPASPATP